MCCACSANNESSLKNSVTEAHVEDTFFSDIVIVPEKTVENTTLIEEGFVLQEPVHTVEIPIQSEAIETTVVTKDETVPVDVVVNWSFESLPPLDFSDVKVKEMNANGTKIKIATTPFDFAIEALCKQMCLLDGVQDVSVIDPIIMDSDVSALLGSFVKSSESIQISIQEDSLLSDCFSDFIITLNTDTGYYSNYKDILVTFNNIDLTPTSQSKCYEIVKNLIGAERAKSLVYGREMDGMDYDGKTLNKYDFSETIMKENASYVVSRKWLYSSNGFIEGVSFRVGVCGLGWDNVSEGIK